MKTFNLMIFLITLLYEFSFSENIAKNSFEFLRLHSSPRTIALGGVNIGDNNIINIFSNPLSLTEQNKKMLSFSSSFLYDDIQSKWLAFSIPGKNSAFGFGVEYVSYGDIYTIDSSNIDTGIIRPRDILFVTGYAYELNLLQFGANLKYANSKMKNTANAVMIDLGIKIKVKDSLIISLNNQNLGNKIKYNEEKEPLPTYLSFGVWYKFSLFDLGYQFFNNFYTKNSHSLGIEKNIKVSERSDLSLRIGYNSLLKDFSNLEGLSFGFGIKIDEYILNYSFVPSNILGNVNAFSISITLN